MSVSKCLLPFVASYDVLIALAFVPHLEFPQEVVPSSHLHICVLYVRFVTECPVQGDT